MNIRQSLLLSVASIAFAAPAITFAAGLQPASGEAATAITFNTAASSLSRAQVQQDLNATRTSGTAAVSQEGAFNFATATTGAGKSRAEVTSELSSSMAIRNASSVI